MQTYISILRGINVSGQKKILMTDLKALYESLGFSEVISYIQSGNVIFKYKKETDLKLAQKIEQAISKKYKFEVPVIIRSVDEMKKVLTSNPYLKQKNTDEERLYVTFLAEAPTKENLEAIKKYNFSPDEFIISGKEIYLHIPNGYGNTKLSNNFFENKLKVTATTRNWKTVGKLVELCQ
ncbi:MAG: hypothetical protein JWN78_2060 [Bacteroidota bacterium]|nr:hypothetical protein [Bacteroidota bacterium]